MQAIPHPKLLPTLYPLLLSLALLFGCVSSTKHLQKGEYEQAISKSVKKLRKKPSNEKEALVLEKAFTEANRIDNDRIKFLKLEGKPDVWEEVFERYLKLKKRQSLVQTILPLSVAGRTINFPIIDYDNEIIQAKRNAAEYYYAHGQKLLKEGDKFSAREAYYEFRRVKDFYENYEDVDKLMLQAKQNGMTYTVISLENKTMFKFTPEFVDILLNVDIPKLNTEWVDYTTTPRSGNEFDYNVVIEIKVIDPMPENVLEVHLNESKEVRDGFEYILDDRGNVMKDSLGNDRKRPKYKTISCKLIKHTQKKVVHIEGYVDYFQNANHKKLKSVPIAADSFFENVWAVAIGDLEALSPENKKHLGVHIVAFPSDQEMIFQAAETLRNSIRGAMNANNSVIK